ncbi:hypothetical protein [Streptomyces xiamenensis]|uniref:hypothetical protein n=1 Tax=Streptomyces xiamenensis TaxID=408015 RepID=UPI0035DBBD49
MIGEVASLAVGIAIMIAGVIVAFNIKGVADRLNSRMKARVRQDIMPSLQPLGNVKIQGYVALFIGGIFAFTSMVKIATQ